MVPLLKTGYTSNKASLEVWPDIDDDVLWIWFRYSLNNISVDFDSLVKYTNQNFSDAFKMIKDLAKILEASSPDFSKSSSYIEDAGGNLFMSTRQPILIKKKGIISSKDDIIRFLNKRNVKVLSRSDWY